MKASWLREFVSPSNAYRGKPFWSWNGTLEPQELRRQIRILKQMGLGGFFMHARVGLNTAYLSPEWFDCVKACVDEARRQGMEAWLYDEDRWPSGAAGGLVTKNPAYRQRRLYMKSVTSARDVAACPDRLAVFTGRVEGTTVRNLRRAGRALPRLAAGESYLVFGWRLAGNSEWYNGFTYLDTLSHAAVRKFIAVTHEAYRRQCGKDFGKLIPGIFTDEPNHGARGGIFRWSQDQGCQFPWTAGLPAAFRKRYGYDLIPHLPEIYFEIEGAPMSRARYHYHDCVTFLFADAFARQIGEWCEKQGIVHTGHALEEDTLSSQTNQVGACMRFYEHMQAPGIDLLTQYWRVYDTAKQVSSAAHQFGRKWRLSETYGCTGWDFPFAGHKALGDWQVALGINLRAQHLSWYTMQGQAKRDYPAGIFYQSPWWQQYGTVEDYYSRLHVAMTRGEEVRDLLVIHPVESMWTKVNADWRKRPDVQELDKSIVDVRDALLGAHIDFDYADEDILSRHGRVTGAAGGPRLAVARAAYRTVVVPPMVTMRSSTLKLLRKFRKAGGTVVFAGPAPAHVDAVASREVAGFAAGCCVTAARGPSLVCAVEGARRVSIAGPDGREIAAVLYLLREDKENRYLFVCNTGHDIRPGRKNWGYHPHVSKRTAAFPDVRIRMAGPCAGPVELDPATGERFAADARVAGGVVEIRTNLPALGSRLFILPRRAGGPKARPRPVLRTKRESGLGGSWQYRLSEPNVLVLDRPAYRIDDGDWQRPDEILRIDAAVRAHLGVQRRGGHMRQPWAREPVAEPKTARVELVYRFNVAVLPAGAVSLAVEQPRTFAVSVNGHAIDTDVESGWWVDRSLVTLPVDPALLRAGMNEVRLVCESYTERHPGLETVYLLGSFGARVRGHEVTMTALPARLRPGDWCRQGLPFYSGNVTYSRVIRPVLAKGRRLFVRVPSYHGVGVRVLVDGVQAGVIGWEPNEVDITAFVKNGRPAVLGIEVLGHRRNSHGPLHLKNRWPHWTGPNEFQSTGDNWTDDYVLFACGLSAGPRLSVRA